MQIKLQTVMELDTAFVNVCVCVCVCVLAGSIRGRWAIELMVWLVTFAVLWKLNCNDGQLMKLT